MPEQKLNHLAIILDGNRRWAKARGLPSFAGHKEGVEAVKRTLDACIKHGIKYLTVYAFSTENWKRTKDEVGYLLKLAMENLGSGAGYFNERNIRVKIFGDLETIDKKMADNFRATMAATKDNTALNFNVCFNYGGRPEIIRAIKNMIKDGKSADEITEDLVNSYLDSAGQPEPDMIVRTSGEQRLSNFLPWQGNYSELYFPAYHWPDFDEVKVVEVMEEFAKRQRRFGGN